jgi:hypothetical protein
MRTLFNAPYRFRSVAVGLASGVALLVLSACNGGSGTGSPALSALPAAPGTAAERRGPNSAPATPTPKLPPQGIYDEKCEPQWILTTCEANDLQAAQAGIKYKIAFIGLSSSPQQFQELLTYDASIGIKQFVAVSSADIDGLEGTNLIKLAEGDGGNWPSTCTNGSGPGGAAATNREFIKCIHEDLKGYKAFGGWYLYDEPGCPNTLKGYCWASLKPSQDVNVPLIASYIHTVDRRPVIGANGGGSYSQYCDKVCVSEQMANMFTWLSSQATPYTGGDYYPIGCPSGNNCNQHISDLNVDIPAIIGSMVSAFGNGPPGKVRAEKLEWVEQAFDWSEEAQCPPTTCSFPTEAQMQAMRDTTLWDSAAAGNPVWSIWWYAQPDANCQIQPVQGCDAAARWSALTQAINAPYPTKPPVGD